MTGEALFETLFPNQPPVLTFFEPRARRRVGRPDGCAVVGVATDDRGLVRIEFRAGRAAGGAQDRAASGRTRRSPAQRALRARASRWSRAPTRSAWPPSTRAGVSRRGAVPRSTRRLRFYETRGLPALGGGAARWRLVGLGLRRPARCAGAAPCAAASTPTSRARRCWTTTCSSAAQKLLARILNVLHHNSLMITGERRIGKTTFLYHLKKALEADEGTRVPVLPGLHRPAGRARGDFFHAVMADVVEALPPSPETRAALRFRAGATRPTTAATSATTCSA